MMDKTHDFLLEIGCEELPPSALNTLATALTKHIGIGLDKHHLAHGELQTYATPRRLAVIVCDLAEKQPDTNIERKGPALAQAFDDNDKPTPACLGFAKSCGVNVDALIQHETEKGVWLVHRYCQQGKAVTDLLAQIVNDAITQLPIPKPMRWGDSQIAFARPVHWVVMLYGKEIIDATILGVKASDKTFGHRFHHPDPIVLKHVTDYAEALFKHGFVIADMALRKLRITKQIEQINQQLEIGQVLLDDALLNEVTALVEWPNALLATFDEAFLTVPKEALIAVMQSHQKCFPVVKKDELNQLLPYFVTVSNIDSHDTAAVIAGNERVMCARLNDAKFFFESDKQNRLASYLPALEQVIYQKQLGNLRDRVQRISALAKHIANLLGEDPASAERAGLLCKSDLKTDMVGEFPALQGIMGYYYALHDGESEAVANAIKAHYQPRFANDTIPASLPGCCVALADKLDTLVGIFGIGQMPTGDKDPFALRRQALGVLRILIEKDCDLDLQALLIFALEQFQVQLSNHAVIENVLHFMSERLRVWYLDQGGKSDVFASVAAIQSTTPVNVMQRLRAVEQFRNLTEAKSLASANKRVNNVLKKSAANAIPDQINATLLTEPAEKHLNQLITEKEGQLIPLLQQKQYTTALSMLAALQAPVDAFFETVLVMTDDLPVQQNRLALLNALRNLFLHVADISCLQE